MFLNIFYISVSSDENNNEQTWPSYSLSPSNPQSEHDPVNTSSTMQDSCPSSASSTLLAGAPEIHNEGELRRKVSVLFVLCFDVDLKKNTVVLRTDNLFSDTIHWKNVDLGKKMLQ
jgi:hypothetical protein